VTLGIFEPHFFCSKFRHNSLAFQTRIASPFEFVPTFLYFLCALQIPKCRTVHTTIIHGERANRPVTPREKGETLENKLPLSNGDDAIMVFIENKSFTFETFC